MPTPIDALLNATKVTNWVRSRGGRRGSGSAATEDIFTELIGDFDRTDRIRATQEFTTEDLDDILQTVDENYGRLRLAIFGKTGVGKSSLINAIFGKRVSLAGVGKPVTQHSKLHVHKDGMLEIFDTKGLEIGQSKQEIISDLERFIAKHPKHPIDAAWYCVRGNDKRFEVVEEDFIKELHRIGIPVIVVLTQVPESIGNPPSSWCAELIRHIESRHLPIAGIAVTNALPSADTGNSYGLGPLIASTLKAVPKKAQRALVSEQQVNPDVKRKLAKQIIASAVSAAVAAGATPIPFSDSAVLVPTQIAMMVGVAKAFGIRAQKPFLTSLATTSAATTLGKSAATNLIKLIPGAGSVVGGAISASIAGSFTAAMGAAWFKLCDQHDQGLIDIETMPIPELHGLFTSLVAQWAKKRREPDESADVDG